MPWLGIRVWSKNLYNLVSFLFLIIITLSFGIHKPGHFLGASRGASRELPGVVALDLLYAVAWDTRLDKESLQFGKFF